MFVYGFMVCGIVFVMCVWFGFWGSLIDVLVLCLYGLVDVCYVVWLW